MYSSVINIHLFNGGVCNSSKYLAWGYGNDQVNYCLRQMAECNSSLDHFHCRRPNIVNYCNHIHQIPVLLHNRTFLTKKLNAISLWTHLKITQEMICGWSIHLQLSLPSLCVLSHLYRRTSPSQWQLQQKQQHHSQTTDRLKSHDQLQPIEKLWKGHTGSVQIVKTIAG